MQYKKKEITDTEMTILNYSLVFLAVLAVIVSVCMFIKISHRSMAISIIDTVVVTADTKGISSSGTSASE